MLLKNISQIFLHAPGLSGRLRPTAKGAVLSLQWRVDNTVPLRYPVCVGGSHVFRKRPQGVVQTLSAAKRGGAERLCDGCPCVGAEEICGVPSPPPPTPAGARITPSLCCTCAGERHLPIQPANHAQRSQTQRPSRLKKVKNLTYEATPNSATVEKLCLQPAQAHPRIRYRRIHVLEP